MKYWLLKVCLLVASFVGVLYMMDQLNPANTDSGTQKRAAKIIYSIVPDSE